MESVEYWKDHANVLWCNTCPMLLQSSDFFTKQRPTIMSYCSTRLSKIVPSIYKHSARGWFSLFQVASINPDADHKFKGQIQQL